MYEYVIAEMLREGDWIPVSLFYSGVPGFYEITAMDVVVQEVNLRVKLVPTEDYGELQSTPRPDRIVLLEARKTVPRMDITDGHLNTIQADLEALRDDG